MRRMVRFGIFVVIAAVLICVAVFTLGRSGTRRAQPTAAAAITETDLTPSPSPAPTSIPRGYVSKALMGDKWPLSIDEGTIVCDRTAILLRVPDGHLYAVNGTARSQVPKFGWIDVREITLPDPNIAGLIMNVQPIIDQGLTLCN